MSYDHTDIRQVILHDGTVDTDDLGGGGGVSPETVETVSDGNVTISNTSHKFAFAELFGVPEDVPSWVSQDPEDVGRLLIEPGFYLWYVQFKVISVPGVLTGESPVIKILTDGDNQWGTFAEVTIPDEVGYCNNATSPVVVVADDPSPGLIIRANARSDASWDGLTVNLYEGFLTKLA